MRLNVAGRSAPGPWRARCRAWRGIRAAHRPSPARLVVHAIDQRHARALQRLGRRDIGEDHEFLDQPVRVEARRDDHAVDRAVGFEHDLALRQIEIERLRARRALACSRRDRPHRAARSTVASSGRGRLVRPAVDGGLRLRVIAASRPSASARGGSVCARLRPSAPITMRTASAARSSFGRSEQRSLEMRSGSIGTTRSGK